MLSFPKEILGGRTFEQLFIEEPKWVEFVIFTWGDNCTGVFLEFQNIVKLKLADPLFREDHEQRCIKFVKNFEGKKIPWYLVKYELGPANDVLR